MSPTAAYLREWRIKNPGKQAEYSRRWNKKQLQDDPDYWHRTTLKWKYQVSREQYDMLYAQQKGLCAICGKPEKRQRLGKTLRLAVDHDHRTTQIRGLLCQYCNLAIGYMQDDIKLLKAAVTYLKAHQNGANG